MADKYVKLEDIKAFTYADRKSQEAFDNAVSKLKVRSFDTPERGKWIHDPGNSWAYICPKCGTESVLGKTKFCSECGKRLV